MSINISSPIPQDIVNVGEELTLDQLQAIQSSGPVVNAQHPFLTKYNIGGDDVIAALIGPWPNGGPSQAASGNNPYATMADVSSGGGGLPTPADTSNYWIPTWIPNGIGGGNWSYGNNSAVNLVWDQAGAYAIDAFASGMVSGGPELWVGPYGNNVVVSSFGVHFPDGTLQSTAASTYSASFTVSIPTATTFGHSDFLNEIVSALGGAADYTFSGTHTKWSVTVIVNGNYNELANAPTVNLKFFEGNYTSNQVSMNTSFNKIATKQITLNDAYADIGQDILAQTTFDAVIPNYSMGWCPTVAVSGINTNLGGDTSVTFCITATPIL